MRFKPLTIILLIFSFTLSARAQDNECVPDLSGVITALEQAQTATDSALILSFMTDAKTALDAQVAGCVNYAPETAGDKRTNPVVFGERHAVEQASLAKMSLQLTSFDINPDEIALMGQKAKDGRRYVVAQFTFYCDGTPDETCGISANPFSAVGSLNTQYIPTAKDALGFFGPTLYGGGQVSFPIIFSIGENETDLVIKFDDFQAPTFFATS